MLQLQFSAMVAIGLLSCPWPASAQSAPPDGLTAVAATDGGVPILAEPKVAEPKVAEPKVSEPGAVETKFAESELSTSTGEPKLPIMEPAADGQGFGATAIVRSPAAAAQRYATASRLNVPLSEIPATVQVLEREQLDQRGASDLNSALYYAPGINPVWRYGGFQQVRSRGFRAILLNNGVRDNRSTFVNSHPQTGLWSLERIEVLKGPSAVLYGYGAVGGVVNMVHKQPSQEEAYELDFGLGTPSQRRAHVGTTGTIVESLSHRLDLGYTFKRDFRGLETRRTGGALALDYQPAQDHHFSLRTSLARDRYNTDSGIPTIAHSDGSRVLPDNAPLAARYNSEQDDLSYSRWDIDLAYEFQLSEQLTLTDRFTYARDEYSYFSSEYLEYVPAVEEGGRPGVRLGWADTDDAANDSAGYFYFFHHWFPVSNQLELKADFATGPVQHKGMVGYEFTGLFDSSSDRAGNIFGEAFGTLDWAAPTAPRDAIPIQHNSVLRFNMQTHSVYVHEHAKLPGNLTLVLGGRYDKFLFESHRDALDSVTGQTVTKGELDDRDEQAFTGRIGLLYSPVDQLTGYVSFGSAFKPDASPSPRPHRIVPERAKQLEIGVRVLDGDRLTINAAAYRIWKTDVTIPVEMDQFETAGKVSSHGLELDVEIRPIKQLAITTGVAWTDARYTTFRTRADEDLSGNRVPFAPSYTGNLWLQYLPVSSLGIGLGGRAMGQQYADRQNTMALRPYYLMDMALWFRTGPMRVTLTVNNVFDEGDYVVSAIYKQLTPGPQREMLAQLHVDL